MKTCGIICEYNPFHNGHKYQIEQARKKSNADIMIAVISGHFTQRGEPAIIDKWKRAEAAVRNGIDLVIELPYIFSTQAATSFAHGGVHLLKLCKIDAISFGSECGNLENLQDIAATSVNPDHLRESLNQGMSYPRAYSLLTANMAPNDILAVSYLKEIQDTSIEPILIQRTGGYLDPEIKTNASALAIRTALKDGSDLMDSTPMENILRASETVRLEQFWPYIRTFLLMTPSSVLSQYFLFSEGIENHLKKNAQTNSNIDSFLKNSTTYRYTTSKIRRCLLQAMMQIQKNTAKQLGMPDTLRVLAMNDKGRNWLSSKRKSNIKIASRFADIPKPWRDMEYQSTLLYTSVLSNQERERICHREIQGISYIKD